MFTGMQYITRADYQINDSRYAFNTRIHRNLVSYVKQKFFNKPYLGRMLTVVHGVRFQVSAYACIHTHILTSMPGMHLQVNEILTFCMLVLRA